MAGCFSVEPCSSSELMDRQPAKPRARPAVAVKAAMFASCLFIFFLGWLLVFWFPPPAAINAADKLYVIASSRTCKENKQDRIRLFSALHCVKLRLETGSHFAEPFAGAQPDVPLARF